MTASSISPGPSPTASRRPGRLLGALLCLVTITASWASAQEPDRNPVPEERKGKQIFSVPIEGPLNPTMVDTFRRIRAEALAADADFLVFEIDTPGGDANLMMDFADQIRGTKDIQTIAWVIGNAWSAGALLALACDKIYMRPTATIGSATPVVPGVTMDDVTREKTNSAFRNKFIAYAQTSGRPEALAEAMVESKTEVREVLIQGQSQFLKPDDIAMRRLDDRTGQIREVTVIVREGDLLNLTARDAVRYRMADGVADTRQELQEKWLMATDADWVVGQETWSEGVASFLNAFKILLILAGCVLLYVEFKVPGFGLPGIGAIVCFGLLLSANYISGLASVGEILLVVLGLALIAVEIFVLPGFGIAGLSGIVLLILGLILSLQSFALPSTPFEERILFDNLVSVVASFALFLVVAPFVSRFLPKLPLFRGIMLQAPATANAHGGGAPLTAPSESGTALTVGSTGDAVTDLHPSGKVRVAERVYDVIAQGQFVERGESVRVVQVRGNRILVRATRGSTAPDRA